MTKAAMNKASKKTMSYIQIFKNLKISHKNLHACFFAKKYERSVRTEPDAKQLTDGTKEWLGPLCEAWVLWLFIPLPVHAQGWGEPRSSIVSPPDARFLHSLPSPSQHPIPAKHPSRLPICAHPDSLTNHCTQCLCPLSWRKKPLALYKRCPGVFSWLEPSGVHAVGGTWTGSLAISGHALVSLGQYPLKGEGPHYLSWMSSLVKIGTTMKIPFRLGLWCATQNLLLKTQIFLVLFNPLLISAI